jgi:alpha-D-ribose 1-methylphosphonate 5-phosphate C-P lyase
MDSTQDPNKSIRRFVDHYGEEAATTPLVDEQVVQQSQHLDPLSQPAEPQVISNQPPRSEPSPAMLRTFKLQEEINRRRKQQAK